MSKLASETRTIRNGLYSYLPSIGWTVAFSEGWAEMDIEKPLVNVYIIDGGKQNLELGRTTTTHKLFNRLVQVDVFMESEDRVRAVCEDVMEYLDAASLQVNDILTTSGIGYISFPETDSITSIFFPPIVNDPEILRWRGSVRGKFEAWYPNGGEPL